jgi:hypothetical protein
MFFVGKARPHRFIFLLAEPDGFHGFTKHRRGRLCRAGSAEASWSLGQLSKMMFLPGAGASAGRLRSKAKLAGSAQEPGA